SLGRRMGEFLGANPRVNIELAHTNSPATLLEEGLDVLLRVGSIADSNFVARELGSTNIIACASPGYLDRHGRPKCPQDLSGHRAIIPGHRHGDTYARWTFSKGSEREVVRVPVSVVWREGVGLGVTAVGGVGVWRVLPLSRFGLVWSIFPEKADPDLIRGIHRFSARTCRAATMY